MTSNQSRLTAVLTGALGVAVLIGGMAPADAATARSVREGPVYVALDADETVAAASLLEEAERICDVYVEPTALTNHTAAEWAFPVCAVAVHVCAVEARDAGAWAVVTIHADSFDCGEWTGILTELPWWDNATGSTVGVSSTGRPAGADAGRLTS
jgi:hypothetical protein